MVIKTEPVDLSKPSYPIQLRVPTPLYIELVEEAEKAHLKISTYIIQRLHQRKNK